MLIGYSLNIIHYDRFWLVNNKEDSNITHKNLRFQRELEKGIIKIKQKQYHCASYLLESGNLWIFLAVGSKFWNYLYRYIQRKRIQVWDKQVNRKLKLLIRTTGLPWTGGKISLPLSSPATVYIVQGCPSQIYSVTS